MSILYINFKETNDFIIKNEQINSEELINNIKNKLENSSRIFLHYFNNITSRSKKKELQKLLFQQHLANIIIYRSIQEISNDILSEQCTLNINYCIDLLNFIYFVRNANKTFNEDVNENLFMLLYAIFGSLARYKWDDFPALNHKTLSHLANLTSKQLVIMLNESENSELIEQFSTKLVFYCIEIFSNRKITFDLKIKTGLIFVYALNALPVELKQKFVFPQAPCLDLVQNFHLIPNDTIKVIIYSSILNVLSLRSLLHIQFNGKCLAVCLYEQLIECAKRSISISSQIVEVSRVLLTISKHLHVLQEKPQIISLFKQGLDYVCLVIEHFIDTVRNYAKLFYIELINLACQHYKHGDSELLDILIINTKNTLKNDSLRFIVYDTISNSISCNYLMDKFPNLHSDLLELCSDETISERVCKTYINLLENHKMEINYEEWLHIWIKPVTILLKLNLNSTSCYQRILFSAFQLKPTILHTIFSSNYMQNTEECKVLLNCLLFARKNNIKIHDDDEKYWHGLILKENLDILKVHQDEEVQILTLALIVDTQKTTELFQEFDLTFLLSFLHYNITNQSPNIHKQISTYYKRSLFRLEASNALILRTNNNLKSVYKQFANDFYRFLTSNLTPDSNYYRRSISFELLLVITQSNNDIWRDLKQYDENLYHFLADSYENNKQMVVELILALNKSNLLDDCDKFIETAMDIRPSKTLTAAYTLKVCKEDKKTILNKLISKLNELCDKICNSTDFITCKTSFYGVLLCIRHLITISKVSKEFFHQLIEICWKIREKIMPIVCSPSPEGYLPTENCIETDKSSKAQMILVYAWRTMKEITLLLAEIVTQTIRDDEIDYILQIGQFFIEIFYHSKHRGVFEQAHVGFTIVSRQFWTSQNEILNSLPKKWLQTVLNDIIGLNTSTKLCPTRRSAGLPFLILSILITEPGYEKPYFHKTINSLLETCENQSNLVENHIHCMNILRAVFRHSKLGELVANYIERAVQIAILGFRSPNWGVRNSSTLLYSSLMTRIFGVQRTNDSNDVSIKNRLTIRAFSTRYPHLYGFLLEHIEIECRKRDSLILHPILMILARLYPAKDTFETGNFLHFINICMDNPVFLTREWTVRASLPFISTTNVNTYFLTVFQRLNDKNLGENTAHSLLLQALHVLSANKLNTEPPIKELMYFLQKGNHSTLVVGVLCDLLFEFLHKYKQYNNLDVLKIIVQYFSCMRPKESHLNLIFYIVLNKFEETSNTFSLVANNLMQFLQHDGFLLKKYALEFLICLNERLSIKSQWHSLYVTKEFEFSNQLLKLISSFSLKCCEKLLLSIHQQVTNFILKEIDNINNSLNEKAVLFILLNYYPCIFNKIDKNPQVVFKKLLKLCENHNEEIASAVLSSVSVFLANLTDILVINTLDLDLFVKILSQNASPAAADCCRLTVCQLLQKNHNIFYKASPIIENPTILCDIFNITMVLLEDEEQFIRSSMSNILLNENQIAEKTREDLLKLVSIVLPKEQAISFIFSWCCRYFPNYTNNDDENEIFERGELNLYAENVSVIPLCIDLIKNLLNSIHFTNVFDCFTYLINVILKTRSKSISLDVINVLEKAAIHLQTDQSQTQFFDELEKENLLEKTHRYYLYKIVNAIFEQFLVKK